MIGVKASADMLGRLIYVYVMADGAQEHPASGAEGVRNDKMQYSNSAAYTDHIALRPHQ